MKTSLLSLLFLVLAMSAMPLQAQDRGVNNTGMRDTVLVLPEIYFPGAPIAVVKAYVSTDGCPDYRLTKDSVVENRVYVGVHKIDNSNRMCTQVISYFRAPINLGPLRPGTEIYLDGELLKVLEVAPAFSVSGIALAGEDTLQSGRVVLISKQRKHAVAMAPIYGGKYVFSNVPKGEYTVFVQPDRRLYRAFLPTFYVDKLWLREADFFVLDENKTDIAVSLASVKTRPGSGRIEGRVTYENEKLRDSVYTNRPSRVAAAEVANDVVVMLLDRANQVVAWTLTDDYGRYSFDAIATVGYRVISETTSSEAESDVMLSSSYPNATVDLVLKTPSEITGLNPVSSAKLRVSPTVVTDYMEISLDEAADVTVFNMQGQQVWRKSLDAGKHTLDAGVLPGGILMMKAAGETLKFIKR
jgi:hypothetical protein